MTMYGLPFSGPNRPPFIGPVEDPVRMALRLIKHMGDADREYADRVMRGEAPVYMCSADHKAWLEATACLRDRRVR